MGIWGTGIGIWGSGRRIWEFEGPGKEVLGSWQWDLGVRGSWHTGLGIWGPGMAV